MIRRANETENRVHNSIVASRVSVPFGSGARAGSACRAGSRRSSDRLRLACPSPQAGGAIGQGPGGQNQQARVQAAQPAPRDLTITAIPGVVAAGGKWTKIWQAAGNSADGILPDKDGSVLVAQEDYDTVLKIDENGNSSVAVANAKGIGSLSMDRQGRLYGAHRTERPGSTKPDKESIVNAITMLAPERKTITDKWADGTPLTVRPNDLLADGTGGAYFTVGCLYYATPNGVTVVADNIRTNGIAFSPDDKTLYVTNGGDSRRFRRGGTRHAHQPPRFRECSRRAVRATARRSIRKDGCT